MIIAGGIRLDGEYCLEVSKLGILDRIQVMLLDTHENILKPRRGIMEPLVKEVVRRLYVRFQVGNKKLENFLKLLVRAVK